MAYVVVQAKEVHPREGRVLERAAEVAPGVLEHGSNIRSRVADRDVARSVQGDVLLHITDHGTDVSWCALVAVLVQDLVAGEEAQQVRVVPESLDHVEDVLHVVLGVRERGVRAVNVLAGLAAVDVDYHVHAGGVEDGHTFIVVQVGRQVVHPDGVHTKLLHENGISETGVGIAERVSLASETC